MLLRHAVGFLLMGALLAMLPQLAPDLCRPNGMAGPCARESWLQLMSLVQMGLAGGVFVRRALGAVAGAMKYALPAPVAVRQAGEPASGNRREADVFAARDQTPASIAGSVPLPHGQPA